MELNSENLIAKVTDVWQDDTYYDVVIAYDEIEDGEEFAIEMLTDKVYELCDMFGNAAEAHTESQDGEMKVIITMQEEPVIEITFTLIVTGAEQSELEEMFGF